MMSTTKNPPLFYLLALFIVLNLMDIVTTLFIIRGEANPLYHLTGSILPVFILKIIIMIVVVFMYYRGVFSSNTTYYMLIVILVYTCVALTIAQISNIYAMFHPAVLAEAAAASTSSKVSSYVLFMNLVYLLPIFLSWLSFIIFDKSVKHITVDKEYFRKRKWWKI